MRRKASYLLSFLMVFSFHPLAAECSGRDSEEVPSTLEKRLADMRGEVERFLHALPEADHREFSDGTLAQEKSLEGARWRVRFLMTSLGREISVVLLDGNRVRGELETRGADHFILVVPRPELTKRARGRETIRYADVRDADLPEPPIGRTVEIELVGGLKARGRLVALTDRAIMLEEEHHLPRDCPYPEVAAVRTVGMSKGVKIAIGAGVVAAVLALLGYFVIAPATGA